MLGCQGVHHGHGQLTAVDEVDRPVLPPRSAGDLACRQCSQLAVDLAGHFASQPLRGRDQARGGCRAVLGLSKQVGCDHLRRGRVVGDDRDLGGTGEHVDADPPEQLALCLCHVSVSGSHQHVRSGGVEQAEGHGGEGLDAADGENALRSGCVCGVEDCGVRSTVEAWRGAADDVGHARHRRHTDSHERAGEEREPARRQVGADGLDRHVTLSADNAGDDLVLEVDEPLALHGGEASSALGAGVQGLAQVRGQAVAGTAQLRRAHLEGRRPTSGRAARRSRARRRGRAARCPGAWSRPSPTPRDLAVRAGRDRAAP